MRVNDVVAAIKELDDAKTLNLIPSENMLSPDVRRVMTLDIANRYHLPTDYPRSKPMPSRKLLHQYLLNHQQRLQTTYGAVWCDDRPLSGLHVMNIVLGGLRPMHQDVLVLGRSLGGHSLTGRVAASFGYRVDIIPGERGRIDLDALQKIIKSKPSVLIYIDHSVALEIHNYPGVLSILRTQDTLFYDISHIHAFWLNAEKPPKDARLLFGGSFHKTFPGPQKGFLAASMQSKRVSQLKEHLSNVISSCHLGGIFGVDVALAELLQMLPEYCDRMHENVNLLGALLEDHYEVARVSSGVYSNTHQLWIRCEDYEEFTERCARSRISVYRSYLPAWEEYGMRIGLQEISWRGAGEQTIRKLARALCMIKQGDTSGALAMVNKILKDLYHDD